MKVIDYESRALKCPYCNALIQYKPEEVIQYWHDIDDGNCLYMGILCPHCANFVSEPIFKHVTCVKQLTPEIYLKAILEQKAITVLGASE